MSLATSSSYDLASAEADIRALLGTFGSERLNQEMGKSVAALFVEHFRQKDQQGNKRGWPSQHLYAQFARATHWFATHDTVIITVSHEAANQRYFGGPIDPINCTFLTIPARAEAYGHRAREFPFLQFGRAYNKATGYFQFALLTVAHSKIKVSSRKTKDGGRKFRSKETESDAGGNVYFWLARHVTQPADDTVLPTDDLVVEACDRGVDRLLGVMEGGRS